MQFTSPAGEQRYAELVRVAGSCVVGLDFDGTLAPIVDDPERAHIHPDAPGVLAALAHEVAAIAVVTGRPARQALTLGGLEAVADAFRDTELYLFGQYGNEQWTSSRRRIVGPRPPSGLATFERDLPRTLRTHDGADAFVEDKGLAVAVHTRRMDDPQAAFERLLPAVRDLALRHGLSVEPGRHVIEVRSSGMHKGLVVAKLAEELGAGGFLFAGDDLGDIEAFEAVGELAAAGLPTLRVCSSSETHSAGPADLVAMADVVVEGPAGVLGLLRQLTRDAQAARVVS